MPNKNESFIYWMNVAFDLAAVDGWDDVMVQDALVKASTGTPIPVQP